jgi:hypothetical protein
MEARIRPTSIFIKGGTSYISVSDHILVVAQVGQGVNNTHPIDDGYAEIE